MPEIPHLALIIIDMQNDFVLPSSPVHVSGAQATVPSVRKLLDTARSREWCHMPIFWLYSFHLDKRNIVFYARGYGRSCDCGVFCHPDRHVVFQTPLTKILS